MYTRRIAGTFLAAALALGGAAGALGATLPEAAFAAPAEQVALTSENAELFLPATYEQYLSLDNPSYVAMSERYLAVADGKTIYVYDRDNAADGYRKYTHNPSAPPDVVGKIQFTDDNRLYFSSPTGLYELSMGELSSKRVSDFVPYTFHIYANALFAVTAVEGSETTLYRFDRTWDNYELAYAQRSKVVEGVQSGQSAAALITYAGGTLYCTVGGTVLSYDGETLDRTRDSFLLNAQAGLVSPHSVCAANGALYYTDAYGLHRSDFAGNSVTVDSGSGYSSLMATDDTLYCLIGKNVRAYDLKTEQQAGYEISAASDAKNRLNGAVDIARGGNLVVTADRENGRISVYNCVSGEYSLITVPSPWSPTLVATDGKLIAFAAGSKIWTCEYGSDAEPRSVDAESDVTGLVCTFGTCFYVTRHHRGNATTGESVYSGNYTPTALTVDLYGNLYVASETTGGNTVYVFESEALFLDQGARDLPAKMTLPTNFSCLRADFEGNLYYLDGEKALCKNGEKFASIDGTDFVYASQAELAAFALGYEDDAVYFLFGDFVVRSHESKDGTQGLGFPTLATISAEGVYENVFKEQGEISLYDIAEGSVGIRVEMSELTEDAEYLNYAGHLRRAEAHRGVLLSQVRSGAQEYLLVALNDNGDFSVDLFLASACEEVLPRAGEGGWWTEESRTLYTVSNITAYYFPCLVEAMKIEGGSLPRGTQVTLLATVKGGIGYDFAYVEFSGTARGAVRGYVPLSALTEYSPWPPADAEFRLGYLKASGDGVTFSDADGNEYVITERTYMRFYLNGDGTYTAQYTAEDGTVYTAVVTEDMIEISESDAWRTALIAGLAVLALVIIGAYIFLRPWGKKKKK